jgi:hypothetical protein
MGGSVFLNPLVTKSEKAKKRDLKGSLAPFLAAAYT